MNLNGNDSQLVAEALSARGVPFVYSTGNTGHGMRDGYSDRPVLKKPFNPKSRPTRSMGGLFQLRLSVSAIFRLNGASSSRHSDSELFSF